MAQAETWYGDGTFQVAPRLFTQLYTIHAPVYGQLLPLVYCLLTNKTTATYTAVFSLIKESLPLPPRLIHFRSDYENATMNAMINVFPHVKLEGCLFHFSQANWRKIEELGLSRIYSETCNSMNLCGWCPALAFVPADNIHEAFEELKGILPEEADPLSAYFEKTWVGYWQMDPSSGNSPLRPQRLVWKAPLFSPDVWSVYGFGWGAKHHQPPRGVAS